ncbi:Cohesin loading factor [Ascosphaera apis ARSEF 7405]|uniref:Cohesin loading factor n=1 Tax=Ascosphaera apis ARSEF 7405 TaxID=392613 RepID=A0A167VHD2_9EURO|nr:Cohesin loading factor [Ascosphaera apis ARSEF 7405]
MQTRDDLKRAIAIGQETSNGQVTYLAVTFFAYKFFKGVINPQAEKHMMLAHAVAKSADNKLWRGVTEELLADCLERHGKSKEAVAARRRADNVVRNLPAGLREVNSLYVP